MKLYEYYFIFKSHYSFVKAANTLHEITYEHEITKHIFLVQYKRCTFNISQYRK